MKYTITVEREDGAVLKISVRDLALLEQAVPYIEQALQRYDDNRSN